ncbi:MAG: prolyl oligopeptidase family serine peptidase [Verrucomicrobiota bacterium]|nr:prolyl oligopeptidase family serine peptidase [Limisphaera sp.]MDW8383015.1 prolyl oligopeptidase family serine peptidase [Verrucomicrobiota bacterium]
MSVAAARCAEAAEPFPRFRAQKFETRLTRHVHLPYLLALPQLRNQAAAPAPARWPLLLFLHGAGERGNDLSRVLRHGPPALVQQGTNFPFILVAPQCPDGQRWDAEALMALLEDCVRRLPVDPARVYVTGLSMGGYGTWKLGLLYPERLAAIVPICGGGEWIDVRLAGREKADALRSLAVWAFHGARDNVVPLNESERMVNALKESGAQKVRFTVYPEADHDAWTITYQKAELYQWLLEQSRPTAAWPQ